MVFVLIEVIFDFFIRILKILFELLHPFGYDPQHSIRFHEENTVIDLFLAVGKCVLWYFPADQILRVSLDLLAILNVLRSWFVL